MRVLIAACVLISATACSSGPRETVVLAQDGTQACDHAALADVLAGSQIGSRGRTYRHLAEVLPNVRYAIPEDPEHRTYTHTDSVVLARVLEVVPDRGFVEVRAALKGQAGADVIGYEDVAADWRTVQVELDVAEELAGSASTPLLLELPVLGNADDGVTDAEIECGLQALDDVVVFTKAVPTGEEHLGLTRTMPDPPVGVATVDEAGRLSFPFADVRTGLTSEEFLGELRTLDGLRAAARQPDRVVPG